MTVRDIAVTSFVFCALAWSLYRVKRVSLSRKDLFTAAGASLVLLILSFFISNTKIGGTVMYEAHGFPHVFYHHSLMDVIDKTPIDTWALVPGPMMSYMAANVFFYFSFSILILLLVRFARTKRD